MFFLRICIFSVFLALLAAGCATSADTGSGIVYAPPRADEATMERRAEELSKAIAPCRVRGLAFYPARLAECHFESPSGFLAFIRKFGFNRLYVYLTSPESLEFRELSGLLGAAAEEGMPVEAVLPESCYVIGRRGNGFIRPFVSGGTSLEEMLEKIREFEAGHFRFAGITVLAEPHLFTAANARRPKQLVYAWSEKTFGPGLDNDRIMKATLEKLAAFSTKLGGTPLTIGIPDFYEELVAAGRLTGGSVTDFEAIAPKVIVRNSGNKPTEVIDAVVNELKAAKPGSLLVSITLAEHTSVTAGSLRRRNWGDFTRSLSHAVDDWKRFPAFDGVVLGPFSQIETLHQEK